MIATITAFPVQQTVEAGKMSSSSLAKCPPHWWQVFAMAPLVLRHGMNVHLSNCLNIRMMQLCKRQMIHLAAEGVLELNGNQVQAPEAHQREESEGRCEHLTTGAH